MEHRGNQGFRFRRAQAQGFQDFRGSEVKVRVKVRGGLRRLGAGVSCIRC